MPSIGVVARQTGVSTETLRKWELRYGFPSPTRTSGSQRIYSDSDVKAIHQVAQSMAGGLGIRMAISALKKGKAGPEIHLDPNGPVQQALALLQRHALPQYEALTADLLARMGIERFVTTFALPLAQSVGNAWQAGDLPVFAEHAFASHMQMVVANHLASQRVRGTRASPQILLALPSGETHRLALVLLGAMLEEAGVPTLTLQDPLPATEIASAAQAYGVQVVALSSSAASSARVLRQELEAIRNLLPGHIQLWVGGKGAQRLTQEIPGVELNDSLSNAIQRMKDLLSNKPDGLSKEVPHV